MYACPFAFSFSFHFFPALLLLSLYPSWLARKRWLTFSTPHNPVTLCSRRRLLFLFFLFFFLQEGSFEASYLASSFSYLAFFFYRSSPLVDFPRFSLSLNYQACCIHTTVSRPGDRASALFLSAGCIASTHTHRERKSFPACFRGGYVCSSTVPAFLGPSICYRGMYLHI